MFCNSFLLLLAEYHFFLILIVSTTVVPLCLLAYSVVTKRPVLASLPRLIVVVFGIIKRFYSVQLLFPDSSVLPRLLYAGGRMSCYFSWHNLYAKCHFPAKIMTDNDKMSVLYLKHTDFLLYLKIK